ncbi:MAG: hypothetical protein A2151_07225 [Candidatus Muproteobacteria bacterium RBG_16_65_34]|uniref:ATP synthase subunit I n=1 Tax=Candidatus Muproteobacteria bacterium RBG_16_65_34 TaxID=1817760 RepID=A0A1F6TU60_9PROT|nr:MAG: hypothetical protein A2151_07225 [Candidatus Muproteobacteria bacterium RBG_16_65_34]
MNADAEALRREIRRVVLAQALITVSVAAVFWFVRDRYQALAALYGGATALLSSVWLGRGVQRAGAQPRDGGIVGALFVNALMRYVAAILLLGLGIGALRLAPVPLVFAFAVAQFGFLANVRRA